MVNSYVTVIILILNVCLLHVKAVFMDNHPLLDNHNHSEEELVKAYFERGYTNQEIINALAIGHAIFLSISTLKRRLQRLNLKRRTVTDNLEDVVAAILKERKDSGSCLGYRSMWKRLKISHGLNVKRDTVMTAMRIIDPESVDRRRKHRLLRRRYINPGPNFMWHIDGNDKLKPYGFAIHGCIDGFSRRILWLEVGPSNNNPYIIASYYLNCLRRLKITPRIIRSDHGTENQVVSFLQTYFRLNDTDNFSGQKSFIFGKSSHNQRIEFWWSILRKQYNDWWMKVFKDLRDSGTYNDSDPLHSECLRFCFTRLLRKGLNNIASEWNQHRLQVKKQQYECPSGIPDILYFFPEAANTQNYGTEVNDEDILACDEMYVRELPNSYGCSENFIQIVNIIKPNCIEPQNTKQAQRLFTELIQGIEEQLD